MDAKGVRAKHAGAPARPSKTQGGPEGLEKRFTDDEFVDLIAFLMSQQEGRGP